MDQLLKKLAIGLISSALAWGAFVAHAAPVPGQGTWETTLKARDLNGNPLANVLDPAAVFFYDTSHPPSRSQGGSKQ